MRTFRNAGALVACLAAFATSAIFGQGRRVAVTIDDLPYASGGVAASTGSEEQASALVVSSRNGSRPSACLLQLEF
jgi:hypothetical protein